MFSQMHSRPLNTLLSGLVQYFLSKITNYHQSKEFVYDVEIILSSLLLNYNYYDDSNIYCYREPKFRYHNNNKIISIHIEIVESRSALPDSSTF